jgi:hypothetical protein
MTATTRRHALPLLGLALGLGLTLTPPLRAQPFRPSPPAAPKVVYDPDRGTCSATAITDAYHSHMRPWSDQPEPVQARLRVLQASMTRASLQRCVAQGHLSADEANSIATSLGIQSGTRP